MFGIITMTRRSSARFTGAAALTAAIAASACAPSDGEMSIDSDDIGGVVTGASGPEAGVWVIAETQDLGTPFVRIVVTDDDGRYVIPDLPEAEYEVWVRGYGLVDSERLDASPGQSLDHTAITAPTPQAAAAIYPAGYWFSLLHVPEASEFPGTGPDGNGLAAFGDQTQLLRILKSGHCTACHALGSPGTRQIPPALGEFPTSVDAWDRRVKSGQAGASMSGVLDFLGRDRMLAMFADWTDRIAAGEVPPAPPRPIGVERNVVITQWDWADPKAYLHDLVSTDRRDPTVNANGPLYGALEQSQDYVPVLDPVGHEISRIPLTVRDPNTPASWPPAMLEPSPYWGDEAIWTSQANVHNPMLDERGRLWLAATVRPAANPDFCREGSDHPSAQAFPTEQASRHLQMWDPETQELTHISTCFGTHHLMFAEDADNTLWTSGGGSVVGWLNTRMFDETGDEEASQGWTPLILDTNGNGQRDDYVEPGDPVDPSLDKRIEAGFYAVAPAPDGSVWATSLGYPGSVVRLVPGPNPSETALAEIYEVPLDEEGRPVEGFSPRGGDVDRNGVMWVGLASGHMASFDRRKCTGPLNGPEATGQHCPEGWTFHVEPLPQLGGVDTPGSAEASYYTWVDQFNTSGLGENTPINTGNASEGLLALTGGEWTVLRVPYPVGFYTKWMDGRIDDPTAGWKGRALWATVSTRAPFHMETGPGTTSKVLKFQIRPNPLAH